MNFTFSNPAGLWALLGVPAVIAIHFLQRRSRRVTITTLFLLQQMRRESETGSRVERLRLSVPLWMQLLMVGILAWLLAGPRWVRQDAVRRIAIVLDASASMAAFRDKAEQAVAGALGSLLGPAARTELSLLSSDPEAPALYHGGSAADLQKRLAEWQPLLGAHDFSIALRAARGLAGAKGVVLLVTDHASIEKPAADAKVISVGSALPNTGWAGVTLERKDGQWLWRAVVRNYGAAAATRQWYAITTGGKSAPTTLTLAPGEHRTLSGPFPAAPDGAMATRLTLVLNADEFPLDDQLPLVLPKPKTVTLQLPAAIKSDGRAAARPFLASSEADQLLSELLIRFEDTAAAEPGKTADVLAVTWPPSVALPENQHTIVFTGPPAVRDAPYLIGQVVGEPHPLTDGLNWQGLLVRQGIVVPPSPQDRTLVWQGERPLISLRTTPNGREQLLCHFDLITSNARKIPALAVLVHRFLESARRQKIAPESANFDLRQRLAIACSVEKDAPGLERRHTDLSGVGATEKFPTAQARLLRAPSLPGFFSVSQGEMELLTAATHFADAREADFSAAKAFDELADAVAVQAESVHEADPSWRLWLLLLLAALLTSWWFTRDRRQQPPAPANQPQSAQA